MVSAILCVVQSRSVLQILSLGSASVPSDFLLSSPTAGSRASELGRLREDAGYSCWARRILCAGVGSRERGSFSVASNLVQWAIPWLFFVLSSDLLGVFFKIVVVVVVGCCCCCCSLWNCSKNFLIDLMLLVCCCFVLFAGFLLLLVGFLLGFGVVFIDFLSSGGGLRFISLVFCVECCGFCFIVVVSSWVGW